MVRGVEWLIIAIMIILFWTLGCHYAGYAIECPLPVIEYLASLSLDELVPAILTTITNSLAGFIIASIAAYTSVMIAILHPTLWRIVYSLNVVVQSISALVWALLGLILFGVASRLPAILVAAATSYPILLSALMSTTERLRTKYSDLAHSLHLGKLAELIYIVMPGSLPAYIAASRSALGVALRISVVAEAFSASGGVGYELSEAYSLGDLRAFYAWALIIVLMMLILDRVILAPLERIARRWLE